MTFKKDDYVIINEKGSLRGRTGKVVLNAGNRIKLLIKGFGYFWFRPNSLRKTKSYQPFSSKQAYVCMPKRIEKKKLTFTQKTKGVPIWKDSDNYLYNDKIVFDSFTAALDYFRRQSKTNNIEVL